MKKIIFVQTINIRSGKGARVVLYDLETLINNNTSVNRYMQVGFADGNYTKPLCSLKVEEFDKIFSAEKIKFLSDKGMLNYFPQGREMRWRTFSTSAEAKYPVFKKGVYEKYGQAFDKDGNKIIK